MQQPQEDLFNLYFKYYESSEPPIIFHRWSLITCLSAYMGRQFWLPFGANRIFPNFYTMLIGHPGARKSTAIKLGKKLFSHAGYNTFAAEKTSKEKFLLDLEGLTEDELPTPKFGRRKNDKLSTEDLTDAIFGKEKSDEPKIPREIFIVADEFNEFVGSGNLEFLSLLGMLWDWDDELSNYQFRLKNSKSVSIYQPTLSILSGNTHAGFVEAFPPQAIGQGFLSRLVLVYGEPSGRKISFPEIPDSGLRDRIVEYLKAIKSHVSGPATLSPAAKHALDIIYRSWKDMEDGRFKHYSNRRFTHLLKLSLVLTAARIDTTISERDVIYANTILSWTERDMPKALGEFGKSKDSDVANKIMSALYEAKAPLDVNALLKLVGKDLDKFTQLGDIITKLVSSDQAQYIPGKGYLPKQKALDNGKMYISYPLLREHSQMYS